MSALERHLIEPGDHAHLPFHRDCPCCRRTRLQGPLPTQAIVPARVTAAVAAAAVVLSSAPASALADGDGADSAEIEGQAPAGAGAAGVPPIRGDERPKPPAGEDMDQGDAGSVGGKGPGALPPPRAQPLEQPERSAAEPAPPPQERSVPKPEQPKEARPTPQPEQPREARPMPQPEQPKEERPSRKPDKPKHEERPSQPVPRAEQPKAPAEPPKAEIPAEPESGSAHQQRPPEAQAEEPETGAIAPRPQERGGSEPATRPEEVRERAGGEEKRPGGERPASRPPTEGGKDSKGASTPSSAGRGAPLLEPTASGQGEAVERDGAPPRANVRPVDPELDEMVRSMPALERRVVGAERTMTAQLGRPPSEREIAKQAGMDVAEVTRSRARVKRELRAQQREGRRDGERRAEAQPRSHSVRPGESLWGIARAELGPDASNAAVARVVSWLWDENADAIGSGDPNLIHPGQNLRMPS